MGFIGLRIKLFDVDESNPWPHPSEFIVFMHCTSSISVSITLFAAYCIVYKSGQMAKTYKSLLLIHLAWTFTHEINCNTLVTPVVFTPFKAGYYNGLFEYFGVPPRYTITFSFALIGANLLSFTQLFAFRLYSVLPPSSRFHNRFFATHFFILFYLIIILYIGIPTYIMYEENADRLAVATEQWGHIPKQLYQWNVLFFARSLRNNLIAIAFIIAISFIALCSSILAVSTFIVIWNHKAMSVQTKRMQWMLFWALVTQVIAYSLFIFFPSLIVLAGAVFFDFLPIAFSNGLVFLMSVSGTSDTFAMLGLTRSYRVFVAHNANRVLLALGLSKGLDSTEGTPVASTSGNLRNLQNNQNNDPSDSINPAPIGQAPA